MIRIYLDACCVNRPFDDQNQDRIRLESEAILIIFSHIQAHQYFWLGSEVLLDEIQQIPSTKRKERIQTLLINCNEIIQVDSKSTSRAEYLVSLGFSAYDALHIACAEASQADILLTTDDKMLRKAQNLTDELKVNLENPIAWIQRRARNER